MMNDNMTKWLLGCAIEEACDADADADAGL